MKLSHNNIDELAQIGLDAAQSASQYISSEANKTHPVELKSGVQSLATQVVTAIDMESQRLILEHLEDSLKRYDLGLLTEESQDDGSRFEKDYFWCIDPLDGTLPFTEQRAGYAVSIALVSKAGEPIIGIVVDPHHHNNYVATRGKGCEIDRKPFQYRPKSKELLVCHFDRSFVTSAKYGAVASMLESMSMELGFADLQIHTGAGAVMNALGLLETSAGCYFKFPKRNPGGGCIWDYAATSLIYKELGLHVSDIFGSPLMLNRSDSPYMNESGVIYATDGELSQAIIKLHQSMANR